jgi:hypothetical protein
VYPDSPVRFCEEVVITSLLILVAFFVPLRLAFDVDEEADRGRWLEFDVIVDVVFILDPLFSCFLAFYTDELELVTDQRRIILHYRQDHLRLLLDAFAALPVMVLCRYTPLWNWLTLLKLVKANRTLSIVTQLNHPLIKRVVLLLLLLMCFFASVHFNACIFFYVGKVSQTHGELNWIDAAGIENSQASAQYIMALYWSCATFTSTGYGDVSAVTQTEQLVSSIAMLWATMCHALVFGSVTELVVSSHKTQNVQNEKIGKINLFMAHANFPQVLRQKVG